jgi:hypothetical protein
MPHLGAGDIDEVVPPDHHGLSTDRTNLDNERRPLPFPEFVRRYEGVSSVLVRSLAGRERRRSTIERRIEFTVLAVERYRLRSSDVARTLDRHPSTVGRWPELAIRHQRTDPVFRQRLDMPDAAVSSSDLDNATMR